MTAQTNLSAMHRVTAERLGPRSAMAYKHAGMYRLLTWSDYRKRADEIAAGLISLGIVPGDRVAMIAENRPEWLFSDIGMLAAAP